MKFLTPKRTHVSLFFIFFLSIVISSALYINYSSLPVYKTQAPSLKFDCNKGRIAEGKRIALTICIRCHYNYETGTLAGRQHGNPKRLGDFYSGNITQDSTTGIGSWSTGQVYYFLKTGIKPSGEYVFDMPKYCNLSDEDLFSIIAFCQSDDSLVRKTNFPNPAPQFSFLTKLLLYTIVRPPENKNKVVLTPDTNDPVAFGRYLCTAKFSCYECHSLNTVTNNYNEPEKSWGFFKGGNPQVNEDREKIYTPNITGDSIKGIGTWSEKDFVNAVKNGIKPNGKTVLDPMFPFYLLTDREAKSMYSYLKTIR